MKRLLGVFAVCLMLVGFASCSEDADMESHITMTIGGSIQSEVDWGYGVSGINGGKAYAYIKPASNGSGFEFVLIAAEQGFTPPAKPNSGIKFRFQSNTQSGIEIGAVYDRVSVTVIYDTSTYTSTTNIADMNLTFSEIGEVGEGGAVSGMFKGNFSCKIQQGTSAAFPITDGVINVDRVAPDGAQDPTWN